MFWHFHLSCVQIPSDNPEPPSSLVIYVITYDKMFHCPVHLHVLLPSGWQQEYLTNPWTFLESLILLFYFDLKFSNSSMWNRLFRCSPYFLSRHSLPAWYAYPELPGPSIDFRASPRRYWRNCKSAYSGVAGAWALQVMNGDF